MRTKREAIFRLRNDLREVTADSPMTNRYLWSVFWDAAKLVLQRAHDDGTLRDQNIFQPYYLDTEEVNLYEGSCVPLECISCRVKIPEPVMSKTGPMYSVLASADLYTRYALVNPTEFEIKSKIKGTKQRYAFLEGKYIYLSKCVPCIKFSVVPTDGLSESKCGVMDTNAFVPDYLFDAAIAIAKDNISRFLNKPVDHTANKNETT